jgi:hypothetical protein
MVANGDDTLATEDKQIMVAGAIEKLLSAMGTTITTNNRITRHAHRTALMQYLIGKTTVVTFTNAECDAMLDWIAEAIDDGIVTISDYAVIEARRVLKAVRVCATPDDWA